jgi:L-asparagine transporter-like permease
MAEEYTAEGGQIDSMKKEDMTVPALLLEAVTLILALVYIGLQIFYGLYYHIAVYKFLINVFAMVLVYAGLTLLCVYPEHINRLPPELFTPEIRAISLRMTRLVKLIFVAGIMVPCVFDALGIELLDATSLIVIGLILVVVIYYEGKIIRILRK